MNLKCSVNLTFLILCDTVLDMRPELHFRFMFWSRHIKKIQISSRITLWDTDDGWLPGQLENWAKADTE